MQLKTFVASLDNLHQMLKFVEDYSIRKNFNPDILNKIVLATEEALVNIINYSYPDTPGVIKILCKEPKKKAGIKIVLKDYGIPFDPLKQGPIRKNTPPPKPSLEEGAKKGGYGIYIFVGVMDRVHYNRMEDGNLLVMTKYLPTDQKS